jgi:3-methyl-2-oxobutanoate hydroxymethyltransferase
MSSSTLQKAITVPWIKAQKGKQRVTMLTAYDYPTAVLLDEVGINILLVGDSVATVLYGEPNTLGIGMEEMLRHTRAVAKGAKHALVVADMPFMSYQVSQEMALTNAGRFLKEAQAHAIKLEGGIEVTPTIKAIIRAGIPVMGHIGLTPQSIHMMGNYRMHGKTVSERNLLIEAAQAHTEAGAFAIVLECIEESLAAEITEKIAIPTIGIGSGRACDGEVLVTHDLVGLTVGRIPSFVKPLAQLKDEFQNAAREYSVQTQPVSTMYRRAAT